MNSALGGLGEALLAWFVPITLTTSAILVVALGADRLLERRTSASARLWLYAVVLARLALPGPWQSPLGLLRGSAAGQLLVGEPLLMAGPASPRPSAPLAEASWVALGYLLVATVLLARWLHARLALRRRLREAIPLGREVDGVPILAHPRLGPLVAGAWRPRIVVPAALASGAKEPLDWVLRHEQAHLRRGDLLLGALVQLVCIGAWPVLPVWIAARRIRALMEVACDERAVRDADGAGRRRYGEVLLALAEGQPAGHALAPVLSFGSPLKARLRALSARRRWPALLQGLVVAGLGAAVVACAAEPSSDKGPAPAPKTEPPTGSAPGTEPAAKSPAPETIPGKAEVRGSLDKEIIRRVIRQHINEMKSCYEERLPARPDMSGRVSVKFTIAATGMVTESELAHSTMNEPTVEACLIKAVRRWQFPRPEGGGIVIVTYPFSFTPSGGAAK
jgi:TonB family protein